MKRAGCVLGLLLMLLVALIPVGQEGQPDIVVTDIEFEVIPQSPDAGRPEIPENMAIIGDKVRIRAVVENQGSAPAGTFDVEFFFEEEATKETNIIGRATVYALQAGGELKPAINWDTSALSPGYYRVIARAAPNGAPNANPGGQEEDYVCNNEIPRKCDRDGDGEYEDEVLPSHQTILTRGKYIAPSELTGIIPRCPMGASGGKADTQLQVRNLGTVDLNQNDLELKCFYRTDLGESFDEKDYCGIRFFAGLQSGQPGTVSITIRFEFLADVPPSAGLGISHKVQLKLEITPGGRAIIIPSKDELLKVFSEVDLWTFPKREGCGSPQGEEGAEVRVPPKIAPDGTIYHVIWTSDGSKLHALFPNGDRRWKEPYSSISQLTSAAVGEDQEGSTIIYVGSGDGNVYAIREVQINDDYFPEEIWKAESIGAVRSRLEIATDQGVTQIIIAGSDTGLHAIDPEGKLSWSITDKGPVEQSPVYVSASKEIWFSSGDTVYKVSEDGKDRCRYQAGAKVIPSLATNQDQTIIYLGTSRGALIALDSSCEKTDSLDLRSPVSGLRVVSGESPGRGTIYVTTDDGHVHAIDYEDSNLVKTGKTTDNLKLLNIRTGPDVLTDVNGDIVAVFISSPYGKLRGISPDLDEISILEDIWGEDVKFEFDSEREMTSAVVDPDPTAPKLLVGSADGFLYAFDLSSIK